MNETGKCPDHNMSAKLLPREGLSVTEKGLRRDWKVKLEKFKLTRRCDFVRLR